MLVDLDIIGDIRNQILEERKGFAFFVKIDYERLSSFCSLCKIIGHTIDNYRKNVNIVQDSERKNQALNGRNRAMTKKTYVPKIAVVDALVNGDADNEAPSLQVVQANVPSNVQVQLSELNKTSNAGSYGNDQGTGKEILVEENGLLINEADKTVLSIEDVYDRNEFLGINTSLKRKFIW